MQLAVDFQAHFLGDWLILGVHAVKAVSEGMLHFQDALVKAIVNRREEKRECRMFGVELR